ncbi:fungal-specific transcription factor domain-containing protein [Xylaria bambusicola]|uniref:fungal-specific transcription factor domain-containing protein n=1 Tax=Xylaria bambusicola TaxID=326684 RepID=UPI002007A6BE|nr:fungal-specific transcription factor domain-containing protein [Xylaria bambusicola]KAI0509684.1 fungal-specific transcription factor domain-containing protein [Xylaria bambusicola]
MMKQTMYPALRAPDARPPKARLNGDRAEKVESSSLPSFEAPLRPKRQQVARACDSCRMHRIKCDNNVPCKNCVSRGENCINKSPGERRTLPQAYREIDRLKQKVKELEKELERQHSESSLVSTPARPQPFALTPPGSDSAPTPDSTGLSHNVVGRNQTVWGGVMTSTGQSPQKTWYGPSSLFYFVSRMNAYLSAIFKQLHPDDLIQLKTVAKTFATPDCNPTEDDDKPDAKDVNQTISNTAYLTPTQEEYFLNLFWQSYHPTLVILDEAEFKRHYRSLATKPGQPRKPSALVDIVIAVSMQVGMAVAERNSPRVLSATEVGSDDPSIAGRIYYRRCQRLLYNEQEAPTLMTVQCHILSAVYTCCAAFQNMSHIALSLAVRSAQMLGLHNKPPNDLPISTQELHRRVWWTLYTFESKASMKFGRPFYTNADSTSCDLPAHDHRVASLAGSDFALLDENNTWLTYTFYNVELLLAARKVHTAFYEKYSDFYSGNMGQVIYDDPPALERYAEYLTTVMKPLDDWGKSVPNSLKTKREGDGRYLSTDRSPIVMEQFVPPWLQRQRLLLESLYHVLKLNLYRPFICFPSTATESSSLGKMCLSHAASAAEHSIALTRIFHHVVTNTDLLVGWHEAFQWQWNAALTLAGYLFACPTSEIAPTVRESIDLSIVVFEDFGRSFGTSLGAATVMRDLAIKIDFLAEILRGSNSTATLPTEPAAQSAQEPATDRYSTTTDVMPSTNNIPFSQDLFSGSMNMAFSVDNSGDLDMLWPPIENTADQWWIHTEPPGSNGFGYGFPG